MSDSIELLKRRKLLELQKKLLLEKIKKSKEEAKIDPISILMNHLTDKGKKIFKKALEQYPTVAKFVAYNLARIILEGRIKEIDGITLYHIFERLGYPIRLETRIVYKSKGKVKTISELLKEKD